MKRFSAYIIAGVLGIWLATGIPGVDFTGTFASLALAGFALGVINFAVKPILDILTLPLRILTLGIFSLFLNIAIVWVVDVLILEKIFNNFTQLFIATAILWILNLILARK
ncbi:MAG: phage holin family protein [Candidatus Pacebacteria bacterium]|nr:phage holin family protein [Candidatus Paceibacterota bacterium]